MRHRHGGLNPAAGVIYLAALPQPSPPAHNYSNNLESAALNKVWLIKCGLCWSPGLSRHCAGGMGGGSSSSNNNFMMDLWWYVDFDYWLVYCLLFFAFFFFLTTQKLYVLFKSLYDIPKLSFTFQNFNHISGGRRCKCWALMCRLGVAAASDWNEWNPLSEIIPVRNDKAITPCGADWEVRPFIYQRTPINIKPRWKWLDNMHKKVTTTENQVKHKGIIQVSLVLLKFFFLLKGNYFCHSWQGT